MAGSSQSSGQSSAYSDTYIPEYSQTPILNEIAQHARAMSDTVYNWGMDRFNKNQGDIDGLMRDALSYASPQRISVDMGQAEAGVQQAAERGRQSAIRDLESYGIDPSSGRYAALDQANRVMSAASAAGAGNQQRMADQAAGNAMRNQAIAAGLQNAQFGLGVGGQANQFLQTGMQLKYPPLGRYSTSQSTQQSSSVSDSGGGGGSKSPQEKPPSQEKGGGGGGGQPAAPRAAAGGGAGGGKGGGKGGGGKKPGEKPGPDDPKPGEEPTEEPGTQPPLTDPDLEGMQPPPLTDPDLTGMQPPPLQDPDLTGMQPAPLTDPDLQNMQPAPITDPDLENMQAPPLTDPDLEGMQPAPPRGETMVQDDTNTYNPYAGDVQTASFTGGQQYDLATGQPVESDQPDYTDPAGGLYTISDGGDWGYDPNIVTADYTTPDWGGDTFDAGAYDSTYDTGFIDTSGADTYDYTDPGYTDTTDYGNYDFGAADNYDYGNYDYGNYDYGADNYDYGSDFGDTSDYGNYDYGDGTDYSDYGDGSDYSDYGDDASYDDYSDYGSDYTDNTDYGSDYTDNTDYGSDYTDNTDYGSEYTDTSGDTSADYGSESSGDSGEEYEAARGGYVARGPGRPGNRRARVMPPPGSRPPTGYRPRPPGFARGGRVPGQDPSPIIGGERRPPPQVPRPMRGAPMMAPGGPRPAPMAGRPMMPGNFISANGMPPPTAGAMPLPQRMARGGQAGRRAEPTQGGFVSRELSPSGGSRTDDVNARLNAGEFVIPKDIAAWKGKEFFYKLIAQARKARSGGNEKPQVGYGPNRGPMQ